SGTLNRKGQNPLSVYWQGPSIGFDFGGNASKVFTLVYNLPNDQAMFQRFPGVDGSAYLVAGVGVNYQQSGNIVLAPMRSGVGLRLGANFVYLSSTRERRLLPF
ncbi:MAG: EipA family protein, partial [Alphaproteobacteria bacterium]